MGMGSKALMAAWLTGASSMSLGGCMLSAGDFTSELAVMKGGDFSYSYDGEIQMMMLAQLAQMAAEQKNAETFTAEPCYDDQYEVRDCTDEDIAQQKSDWEASMAVRAESDKKELETLKAMLGGIDPSDPEATKEIADRLEKQRGWDKVTYMGDGIYDVDFTISGQLTHDFAFPMMERLPAGNPFVTVTIRDNNQVRVDAPGFVGTSQGDTMRAAMMSEIYGATPQDEATVKGIVSPKGTFTIVTNGKILTNNTEEGPAANARGQQLVWNVTPRSNVAPAALIDLKN